MIGCSTRSDGRPRAEWAFSIASGDGTNRALPLSWGAHSKRTNWVTDHAPRRGECPKAPQVIALREVDHQPAKAIVGGREQAENSGFTGEAE
jgi:hypothetical protein